MTKVYKITDISQLALVKNAFDDRKVPAKQLNGSYLYDVYFGTDSESLHAYRMLKTLLENNDNVLYFDYKYGNYYAGLYGGEDEDNIVPLDIGRYSL